MNPPKFLVPLVVLALAASDLEAEVANESEALSGWQWYQDLRLPESAKTGMVDFVLTPGLFDKALFSLDDLRLYDGNGREIPYAIRVRHEEWRQEARQVREFNRGQDTDGSALVTLDFGEGAAEHNEMEIATAGINFRRRVKIEGSDNANSWNTLVDRGELVHYQADMQVLDVRRVHYPVSRFRYLRVRVFPDGAADKPLINSIMVFRSVREPGEYQTYPATLGVREPVRVEGGPPGSAWVLEWPGGATPCERVTVDAQEEDFVRPFRLERADPDEPIQFLASGEWRRKRGSQPRPLEIRFPEVIAHRLRLVITDYRNPPLTPKDAKIAAAARQVIFDRPADLALPFRFYFGNPKAQAPRYDFAANLPPRIDPPPGRVDLGAITANPTYRPAPKPLTERWPWLVYLVLGLSSLVLLGILGLLARQTITRHDAGLPGKAEQPPSPPSPQ
jgi:hypothetical protein